MRENSRNNIRSTVALRNIVLLDCVIELARISKYHTSSYIYMRSQKGSTLEQNSPRVKSQKSIFCSVERHNIFIINTRSAWAGKYIEELLQSAVQSTYIQPATTNHEGCYILVLCCVTMYYVLVVPTLRLPWPPLLTCQ